MLITEANSRLGRSLSAAAGVCALSVSLIAGTPAQARPAARPEKGGKGAAPAGAAGAPKAERMLIERELSNDEEVARGLREFYTKHEYRIAMRDGVKLFTNVYAPKDHASSYPIILMRTPYGVGPYGVDNFPSAGQGHAMLKFWPSVSLIRHGAIFVLQDVRGKMMSEGTFVDVRPHIANKRSPKDIDESSDAWDTIDWLIKKVPGNNGRVGIWGNSYPGFYAAQAAIDAHPALVAVSPQAPVTDWFVGDDFHHNGAFLLADAFLFYGNFGRPRPEPTVQMKWDFDPERGDLYDYFMKIGRLADADVRLTGGRLPFWQDCVAHPDRDEFWRARDPRPHLKKIRPAVMTVGGWYDAEDLWGTLATYRAIEKQSPGATNTIVMGPWRHGGQIRTDGDQLGDLSFGARTAVFYREQIITPFFLRHLKGASTGPALPEAWMFETGTNEWRSYAAWPPPGTRAVPLRLGAGGRLLSPAQAVGAASGEAFDGYVSDPRKPVPYRDRMGGRREAEYMVEDQRFAARRPDVLVYQTEPLSGDVSLAGPIVADLWVSTTGTDADFVVKVVDVFPDRAADPEPNPRGVRMGGYQALVRAEVMRGRYRKGLERPEPFVPGEPTRVRFELSDVNHTFRAGHRVMVQIQSSWFPLVDRNPQRFIDIYHASEADMQTATHRVYRDGAHPSTVTVGLLRGEL